MSDEGPVDTPQENRQRHLVGVGGHFADSHLDLPESHLALHTAFVQVYAYLFGICPSGFDQARTRQRSLSGHSPHPEM